MYLKKLQPKGYRIFISNILNKYIVKLKLIEQTQEFSKNTVCVYNTERTKYFYLLKNLMKGYFFFYLFIYYLKSRKQPKFDRVLVIYVLLFINEKQKIIQLQQNTVQKNDFWTWQIKLKDVALGVFGGGWYFH